MLCWKDLPDFTQYFLLHCSNINLVIYYILITILKYGSFENQAFICV